MLVRFSVANFGSFNEMQELSLVASALRDDEEGLIPWPTASVKGNRPQLLPTAVIFGPNAGGKSKFVDAVMFLRSQVLFSHSRGNVEEPILRDPFRLSPGNENKPSIFVIEFLVDGVLHEYGCELSERAVEAEWLYGFPKRRRQILFEREKTVFEFGRSLRGQNKRIEEFTRSNSLFLSAAAQNNHPQLSPLVKFFADIRGMKPLSPKAALISSLFTSPKNVDDRVLRFLRQIDTGVEQFRQQVRRVPEELQELGRKFFSVLASHSDLEPSLFSDAVKEDEEYIVLEHEGEKGFRAAFDIDEESAGTQRLLFMLPQLLRSLDTGSLFLLDELDVSIHTLVCELILDLFRSKDTNPYGAQLITTTHNTELLRNELLRRDQIWFAEKNRIGATQLTSMADFRTRRDDNRIKGYLEGRFGAIPFARRTADLGDFLKNGKEEEKTV